MKKTFITNCDIETMKLGESLASILSNGSTICLKGDLGAGKTTLVRGIAHGLNISEIVQSPTFNIMKIYLKGLRPLVHIDAYRLADVNTDIGLDEYIGYESGITVIEWPNFIEKLIPANCIEVSIFMVEGDKRKIVIESQDQSFMDMIKL